MRSTREEQGELVMTRVLEKDTGTPIPAGAGAPTAGMSIGVGEYPAGCAAADFVARVEIALASAKRAANRRVIRVSELSAG
jgi:GGDEF domain-containing protein